MISAFFDKTKPINFLLLLGFNMFLFWVVCLKENGLFTEYSKWVTYFLASGALVLCVYFISNITKTKKLTSDNSYAMLFFTVILLVFFQVLDNTDVLFGHLFLMISCDRTLALKAERNQKEKVFESALWIFVASLFVNWAILFLIPLYISIALFCSKQLRFWVMPLASLSCFLILLFGTSLISGNPDLISSTYRFKLSLDFFVHPNYYLLSYIIIVITTVLLVFGKLGYRRLGRTLSLRILFGYLALALLIAVFALKDEPGIELFSFFPAAVFLANYIETIKKNRFKETLIILGIFFPILGFIIRLLQ